MNTNLLIDLAAGGLGVYLVCLAGNMKRTGRVSSVLEPEDGAGACRDEKGYIACVFPGMLLFGLVSLAVGIVCALADLGVLSGGQYWRYGMAALFLAALVLFVLRMRRGRERYF